MAKDCPARFVNFSKNLDEQRTYIIFGMVRSGTSMIAGLLWRIGIDMGNHDSGQYEDWNLNLNSLKKKGEGISKLKKNICLNNKEKEIWGWKDPLFANYAYELIEAIRNPYFILVLRDPFAITERLNVKDDDLIGKMQRAIKVQKKSLDLIESLQRPSMIVSYERSTRNRLKLIEELSKFAGKEYESFDEAFKEKLYKFMKPGRYKDSSSFV